MASFTVRKFLQSRSLWMLQRSSSCYVAPSPESFASSPDVAYSGLQKSASFTWHPLNTFPVFGSRSFCSQPSNLVDKCEGPVPVDYGSMLQEDEFHKLADSTIHDLLEKLEEYGDSIDVDGFDIDYGNEVLTLKLGSLGTYVVNKQTPNRQIWLSSPVSGPSRFDWDHNTRAWIYRRNKANLFSVLESEIEKLCGRPVNLS